MTPARYEQIRRVFLDARAVPPEQRFDVLERARGSDPELVREVILLLAEVEEGSSFLNSPAAADMPCGTSEMATEDYSTIPFDGSSPSGMQIGPYRILRTIGEGGMGTVYEAEQRSPIVRNVA